MTIQIIGTPKCAITRKAERYFKERRVPFHFVDLTERALSRGELEHIERSVPLEELIDRGGRQFARRGLAHMELDLLDELLSDPLLLRTPIVRAGSRAVVGDLPAEWQRLVDEAKHG